jgi:hypothetical protein
MPYFMGIYGAIKALCGYLKRRIYGRQYQKRGYNQDT